MHGDVNVEIHKSSSLRLKIPQCKHSVMDDFLAKLPEEGIMACLMQKVLWQFEYLEANVKPDVVTKVAKICVLGLI